MRKIIVSWRLFSTGYRSSPSNKALGREKDDMQNLVSKPILCFIFILFWLLNFQLDTRIYSPSPDLSLIQDTSIGYIVASTRKEIK